MFRPARPSILGAAAAALALAGQAMGLGLRPQEMASPRTSRKRRLSTTKDFGYSNRGEKKQKAKKRGILNDLRIRSEGRPIRYLHPRHLRANFPASALFGGTNQAAR